MDRNLFARFPDYEPRVIPFCNIVGGFDDTFQRGYSPMQIRNAYGLTANETGAGRKIALILADAQPWLQQDLDVFSDTFGLPGTTITLINLSDPLPAGNINWSIEATLDTQWVHAIAPQAELIVIFAKSTRISDMVNAVEYAADLGVDIITMSWGVEEFLTESTIERRFERMTADGKLVLVAASGDVGGGVFYPSSSKHVLSVGGTSVYLNADGVRIGPETAWQRGGGGPSIYIAIPEWQQRFYNIPGMSGEFRATPDTAFVADPDTGVAIFMSVEIYGRSGWTVSGGTSIGAPCLAGILASKSPLEGNITEVFYSLAGKYFYAAPQYYFRDVTLGNNTLHYATVGYDLCTGLGTPVARQIAISGTSDNPGARPSPAAFPPDGPPLDETFA